MKLIKGGVPVPGWLGSAIDLLPEHDWRSVTVSRTALPYTPHALYVMYHNWCLRFLAFFLLILLISGVEQRHERNNGRRHRHRHRNSRPQRQQAQSRWVFYPFCVRYVIFHCIAIAITPFSRLVLFSSCVCSSEDGRPNLLTTCVFVFIDLPDSCTSTAYYACYL